MRRWSSAIRWWGAEADDARKQGAVRAEDDLGGSAVDQEVHEYGVNFTRRENGIAETERMSWHE